MVGILLVTALSSGMGSLRVDSRLERLLPPDSPSLGSLQQLNERATASATLKLFVASSDVSWNRRLAVRAAERLQEWSDVESAVSARDVSYFSERRLLFLDLEDLSSAVDDVEARVEWEQCDAIPGCVNFDDQPMWPDTDEMVERVRARPEYRAIPSLGESSGQGSDAAVEEGSMPGELCATDGSMCAVEAVMRGDAGDLNYARDVYARARALLDALDTAGAPADLQMEVSGRFRTGALGYEAVVRDLGLVGALSTALILLFVWLQFRRPRALIVLGIPLALGLLSTLGLVGFIEPELNLITAFTLAILAGLGVDFGLHLLTHYGVARQGGAKPEAALRDTLRDLGPTMVVAALTTGAAFAALTASDFHGFAQMGRLAGLGILLALLSFLLLFPPLILWLHARFPERGSFLREHRTLLMTPQGRTRAGILGLLALAGLVGLAIAPQLSFEYNFRNLRPAVISHGIASTGAFQGARGVPVYLLASSEDELEDAAGALRDELEAEGGGDPALLVSGRTFIPRDQGLKLEEFARLREALEDVREPSDPERRLEIDRVRGWASHTQPITAESLPVWAQSWLTERSGAFGRLGILYLSVSGADARAMEALSARISRWRARFPQVEFASSQALLGEIVPTLRADAPWILGLAILALFLATAILARSLRRLFDVASALVVLAGLTALGMTLFGIKLHMYNLLVLPLAFGIGVDGAIYMVWAARDQAAEVPVVSAAVRSSARAVFWSTLTTVGGFGALLVCVNPGLVSLGGLALIALSSALVANLIWLPMWLRLRTETEGTAAD